MTNQSLLNQESLKKLTSVYAEILKAKKFEANQMTQASLKAMLNSKTAIDSMNEKQLNKFESDLIETFKFKNWIN